MATTEQFTTLPTFREETVEVKPMPQKKIEASEVGRESEEEEGGGYEQIYYDEDILENVGKTHEKAGGEKAATTTTSTTSEAHEGIPPLPKEGLLASKRPVAVQPQQQQPPAAGKGQFQQQQQQYPVPRVLQGPGPAARRGRGRAFAIWQQQQLAQQLGQQPSQQFPQGQQQYPQQQQYGQGQYHAPQPQQQQQQQQQQQFQQGRQFPPPAQNNQQNIQQQTAPAPLQPQGVQGPFGRFRGEAISGTWTGDEELPETLVDLFKAIPLEAMMIENWVRKRLVLVGDLQPLDKALQRLNRHKITSLPIISEKSTFQQGGGGGGGNQPGGQILGLLESLDIVHYLSSVLSSTSNLTESRWNFNLSTTGELLSFTKKRALVMSNSHTMYDGLVELGKGMGRLMVVDKECETHEQTEAESGLLGLFTQSDIIRFLGSNPYWLKLAPNACKTLEELGIFEDPFEKVVTVEQNILAFEAFNKIAETHISGVAIVDSNGILVAHLSASNIRGISRRNFQLLRRPLDEFMLRDRRRGWWTRPITIRKQDTLEKTVLQFAASRVHQLYVVDQRGAPTCVVTITDLLRHFL